MSESQQSDVHTLTDMYETIDRLTDTIRQLDAEVDEARRVAHLLDTALDNIRGVMNPIAAHHTPHTWIGQSATRSRHRLDTHGSECTAAIRTVDQIIDELHTRVAHTTARSDAMRDSLDQERRRAISLEFQLGRFDDVAI